MPPDAIASTAAKIEKLPSGQHDHDSLFEHVAWVYVFCREHLFRDDTQRIIAALSPEGPPSPGTRRIEGGCGTGFYSCRLAERFPEKSATGVDLSESQLRRPLARGAARVTENCNLSQIN